MQIPMDVLRAERDARMAAQDLVRGGKRGKRRSDDDFDTLGEVCD